MKTLLVIGYLFGISNPPDGYSECGVLTIKGNRQYLCSVWRDHRWNDAYDKCVYGKEPFKE